MKREDYLLDLLFGRNFGRGTPYTKGKTIYKIATFVSIYTMDTWVTLYPFAGNFILCWVCIDFIICWTFAAKV